MILAKNLKIIMNRRKLTDTHIGKYLKITRQAANAKLNGKRQFTEKDIHLLKAALNTTYDELLNNIN